MSTFIQEGLLGFSIIIGVCLSAIRKGMSLKKRLRISDRGGAVTSILTSLDRSEDVFGASIA